MGSQFNVHFHITGQLILLSAISMEQAIQEGEPQPVARTGGFLSQYLLQPIMRLPLSSVAWEIIGEGVLAPLSGGDPTLSGTGPRDGGLVWAK